MDELVHKDLLLLFQTFPGAGEANPFDGVQRGACPLVASFEVGL